MSKLLKKKQIDYKIVFACDNGERELKESKEEILSKIDGLTLQEKNNFINNLYQKTNKPNFMEMTYKENYDIDDEDFHQDIRFINGEK